MNILRRFIRIRQPTDKQSRLTPKQRTVTTRYKGFPAPDVARRALLPRKAGEFAVVPQHHTLRPTCPLFGAPFAWERRANERNSLNLIMGQRKGSFASDDAFQRFVGEVTLDQRFVWSAEVSQFLNAVRASGARRIKTIPKDSGFYRAQLGGYSDTSELVGRTKVGQITKPHPPNRMKPQWHISKEGRANAAGIPCLYMAYTEDTAIAEVRPWVDAWISLGRFVTNRELRVVDCSLDTLDAPFKPRGFSLAEREQTVWYQINRSFARPTTMTDTRSDYAPTQIIAELFKADGIDGFVYESSCSTGNNLVLFSPLLADIEVCWLSRVDALNISWSVTGANYTTSRFGG